MATRRVIQDSDDDGDGTGSLGNSPVKADGVFQLSTIETSATTSMIQTSSTDPVLFNAIYEAHLGTNQENSYQFPDPEQSPIFDSFIHDPHMSSSDNSSQKLKRSKTTNLSFLTSVSESKTSNRKANHTEAIQELDDLRQTATPRTLDERKERDIWAFPDSSASNKSPDSSAKFKSRQNAPLKTYGRPIRRSQTMVHTTSSPLNEWTIDTGCKINLKRHLETEDEGGVPTKLADTKRCKRSVSTYEDLLDDMVATTKNQDYMGALPAAMSLVSTDTRLPTSETPQSASQDSPNEKGDSYNDTSISINTQIPGITEAPTKDGDMSTFPTNQNSVESKESMVIIPNSLTEAQKSQYQLISVESSIGSRRSSLPEMVNIVDTTLGFADGSSTLPNDTPLPNVLPATARLSPGVIFLSSPQSSPPISTANRKMKRAKSDVALKESTYSVHSKSPSKATKSIKRRKTLTPGQELFGREASVDELSLAPQLCSETTTTKKLGAKKEKRRDHLGDGKDQISVDELFGSDEIGIPVERYQPRSSLRRSNSMLIQPANTVPNNDREKSKRGRKKTNQTTGDQIGSIATNVKLHAGADANIDVTPTDPETLGYGVGGMQEDSHTEKPEAPTNIQSITDTSKEIKAFAVGPKAVLQPKRRGRPRKRTSEFTPSESENTSEGQPSKSITRVSDVSDEESIVLREIGYNEVPAREPSSTRSGLHDFTVNETDAGNLTSKLKEITESPPIQTPKREAKRGPDQHSPLQSGRIAYRVGLSKKTRIAPLLKVIKKS